MQNTYKFTGAQVLEMVLITLTGVLLSVFFHCALVVGFLPGFFFLVVLLKNKKVSSREIARTCLTGAGKTRGVILILLLVSFLLPSWHISGTLDQLVFVSLEAINEDYFFLLSFLISMLFSMLLGTSVGTLSAIGVPIMGTAMALNFPIEITAGALISGSFVGDRTSPFSSAHQLLSHTLELKVKHQFLSLLPTTLFAVGASCIFFVFFDMKIPFDPASSKLFGIHELSLQKFIPPAILVLLVILRFRITVAFSWSILSACFLSIVETGDILPLFRGMFFGIDGIGGGFKNVYLLLLFIALTGAYNGILEEYNVIQPFLNRCLNTTSTLTTNTLKTMLATFGMVMIAANQTLPIILTGRSFLPHWTECHTKKELARVMADSTMIFPGMVPWSILAIMCSTILDVPLFSFLPYAIFLWILPVLTVLFSAFEQSKRRLSFSRTQKTSL